MHQNIRRNNRNAIIQYIFKKRCTSRQEIAAGLHMSMPTVLQNVTELQQAGMIADGGQYESTGGRKASVVQAVADYRLAIGIDITQSHVAILTVDLTGKTVQEKRYSCPFKNDETYYRQLGGLVNDFAAQIPNAKEKVLGVGISVPGFISQEERSIVDSHVLGIRNVPFSRIADQLQWPCFFINDANAAGLAEFSYSQPNSMDTMVYLSLSDSVGGAIFMRGELYQGVTGKSGEFGHMRIIPHGKRCYCGQDGCLDAYCSALRLTESVPDGELATFFNQVEHRDPHCVSVWNTYLQTLALAIVNLRMSFDCDIIIGGYAGRWIAPWMEEIRQLISRLNPFDESGEYVRACALSQNASATGAALPLIDQFMNQL